MKNSQRNRWVRFGKRTHRRSLSRGGWAIFMARIPPFCGDLRSLMGYRYETPAFPGSGESSARSVFNMSV